MNLLTKLTQIHPKPVLSFRASVVFHPYTTDPSP